MKLPRRALVLGLARSGQSAALALGRRGVPTVAAYKVSLLAEKYLGQTPYPWRKEGEQRVSFVIEPTHVYHQDP